MSREDRERQEKQKEKIRETDDRGGRDAATGGERGMLRRLLDGASFCKKWQTVDVVQPSFYMTAASWHP